MQKPADFVPAITQFDSRQLADDPPRYPPMPWFHSAVSLCQQQNKTIPSM